MQGKWGKKKKAFLSAKQQKQLSQHTRPKNRWKPEQRTVESKRKTGQSKVALKKDANRLNTVWTIRNTAITQDTVSSTKIWKTCEATLQNIRVQTNNQRAAKPAKQKT